MWLFRFFLILASFASLAQEYPIVTEEFSFTGNTIHQNSSWETPIVTYNNTIYAVFINADLKLTVVKKEEGKEAITKIVKDYPVKKDLHHTFSIELDKNGYIHLIGDQHNLPSGERFDDPKKGNYWRYWVSKNPEDISEWEFVSDVSSRSIPSDPVKQPTYVKLYRRGNGFLYASFRGNAGLYGVGHGGPGKYGAYVARYDADNREWKLLGSKSPLGESRDLWAYELSGVNESVYQPVQPDVFIGKNGRLHVITGINHDTSSVHGTTKPIGQSNGYRSGTAILYGYSDDNGDSWKKADGSDLTLPNNVKNGDVAYLVSPGEIHNTLSVGAFSNGSPYILFTKSSERNLIYWTGSQWSEPMVLFNAHNYSIIDDTGLITFKKGETIARARFSGNVLTQKASTIKSIQLNNNSKFDRSFREPNKIRMLVYSKLNPMTVKAVTVEFDPENEPPLSTLFEESDELLVYPNPSDNQLLTVEFNDHTSVDYFQIVDFTGKTVSVHEVTNEKVVIDASDLPSGIYVIKTYTQKGETKLTRFIRL